ncbi:MAG: molybdopterin molybdenumtransferase MoeA [Alphaproteobacteria bacterium 13_2_20CM_2_64_7]|nr:MAG: molybdopterin molybdenumtransferase MoeA [Alphaproteobacteria bacterium 13_2_20CM_2_64_7]
MALMPVAEALARVLADAEPLAAEAVPLAQAHGRVLAADVAALRTQPPADVSAMDGYAVRAVDVAKAPVKLKLVGEVAAGHPFRGTVGAGEAARIFTGGVLPPGTDTIVIQENTVSEGDAVVVTVASGKGKHVRVEGLDFKRGAVLLSKGRRLSDRDLALAAAMNHPTVPVHRCPKVALLATGDELVMPGGTPGFGQIVYSNGYATMALARREGCEVVDLGIVPDRLAETAAGVRRAREVGTDILVTSGGASIGDYDLVREALAAEGLALSFWKVALRPGRPMMHGRLGPMHVLGLPGNPVSAYVCAVLFLLPLIRQLAGRSDVAPAPDTARLGRDLPANDERADYLRAVLTTGSDGIAVATPAPVQDSSMLMPLARADCLLIREPFAPAAKAGDRCSIIRLAS